MDYLAEKNLKKTRELWEKLASERELVITPGMANLWP